MFSPSVQPGLYVDLLEIGSNLLMQYSLGYAINWQAICRQIYDDNTNQTYLDYEF